jgi:hypothetical protein
MLGHLIREGLGTRKNSLGNKQQRTKIGNRRSNLSERYCRLG